MNELYLRLGQLLKLERERRKLQLATISEELKVSEESLRHIEAGEYEHLPGNAYFNLFAKSYAEFLGIDFSRTIEAIREDIGDVLEAEQAPGNHTAAKEKAGGKPAGSPGVNDRKTVERPVLKKLVIGFLAVIAALVVYIALYLLFFSSESKRSSRDTGLPDSGNQALSEDVSEDTPTDLTRYDRDVPQHEPPCPLRLRLVPREECWAMVLADGDTTISQTLAPWHEYKVEATDRLLVSIAHPSMVEVTLNDRVVDLRDKQSRGISGVEINRANVGDFLNAAEPVRPRTITTQQSAPEAENMPAKRSSPDGPGATDSATDSVTLNTQVLDDEA